MQDIIDVYQDVDLLKIKGVAILDEDLARLAMALKMVFPDRKIRVHYDRPTVVEV